MPRILKILQRLKDYLRGDVSIISAYKFHCRANWAADQLRLHTNAELKDIGLHRVDIMRLAHAKCPWCHGSPVFIEGTTEDG